MTTALSKVVTALAEHPDPTEDWLVGEPWFKPPKTLLKNLRKVSTETAFPYSPLAGEAEFLSAVAKDQCCRDFPLDVEQVVATHGAKGGLFAVMSCLLGPGDEVLHPTPCYPAYRTIVRSCGATPVGIDQPGDHFCWDRAAIEDHITDRTRALVLSSPANPGGATLTADQARLLVEVCRDHTLRLVCDEAYVAFGPSDAGSSCQPATWDPSLETVIQIRSFSKSHAVCGWRLGYVAADQGFANRVAAWQGAHLNPPNSLAQLALADVVALPESYFQKIRREVRRRLMELARVVSQAGLPAKVPVGGFYLWVDVRPTIETIGLKSSLDLCLDLARNHGIGVWPGEDFFAPGWVRLSAVAIASQRWRSAITRLGSALENLNPGDVKTSKRIWVVGK